MKDFLRQAASRVENTAEALEEQIIGCAIGGLFVKIWPLKDFSGDPFAVTAHLHHHISYDGMGTFCVCCHEVLKEVVRVVDIIVNGDDVGVREYLEGG